MTRARLLLATACCWDSTVPLAAALRDAGFDVAIMAPKDHPLHSLAGLRGRWLYHPLQPLKSLRRAVEAAAPSLVLPGDESAMVLLRKLNGDRRLAANLRAAVAHSLGNGDTLPLLASRAHLMEIGAQTGVQTPRSAAIGSVRQLLAWLKQHGTPAYVKIDRSNGGKGVVRVDSIAGALLAYLRLRVLFGVPRLLWLWLRARDLSTLPLLTAKGAAAITVQSAIEGPAANCAFAAWQGKLLACVSVEALQTSGPTGVATVVRVRDDALMLEAARKVAGGLGLSGLFGLDFILDRETGEPWLIEVNARPTQTAYLRLGAGADLAGSLYAAVTGTRAEPAGTFRAQEVITLFEQPSATRPRAQDERAPALSATQDPLALDLHAAAGRAVLSP